MKAKLLIPVLMLLIGCNTANKPITDSQKESVKSEATGVIKVFFQSLAGNDTAKMRLLIENSPDFTFVNSGGVFGYEDMQKMVNTFFKLVEKQTFEMKSEKYSIIDPSNFVYTWYGKNGIQMKSGETSMMDDFLGTYIFRKTGSDWKMVYGHESSKLPDVTDPVKVFTQIETDWNNAVVNKDEKALDLLYAKEYAYTNPSGKVYNKQEDMSEITSGTYKTLAPPALSNIKATVYGNVALVTGINAVKASLNGKDVSGSNQFTDVFVWRDGRWQCISTQSAQIPRK